MPNYLIGIDVGGTNTDSVLIDPKLMENSVGEGVLAWNKSVTTPDVSDGIELAIDKLFSVATSADKKDVQAITIGTTHFINAIIEQDRSRLDKVAILRLCGPYTKNLLPFSDFPSGLASIMNGYVGFVDGGHRIDGEEIRALDEQLIRTHCTKIKALGIKSIAVVGIFANLKPDHEKRAEEIIREEFQGDVDVVLSHEISGINYVERENATILNTSIIKFAQKIINSFVAAVRRLGLSCPVFLTQNNGTILTVEDARRCAIRTFSSGATNSMRGAKYLCSSLKELAGKAVLVGDVGGTTLDVGLLLPSGFPRLSSSFSTVGGVRMNFSMPFVESIGLGGGSIVREEADGSLTVGPDSVGADIITRSLVFGGDTVTTTDVTVSKAMEDLHIGDSKIVHGKFDHDFIHKFNGVMVKKIENVIDKLRTSPEPLPLILVGGGSFIVPYEDVTIDGTSMVLRPPFYQVANAIGAAMGKLSDELHHIQVVNNIEGEREIIVQSLIQKCADKIVSKGAVRESVDVIDIKVEPVPYVDRTYSFEVKIVADVDYERLTEVFNSGSAAEAVITSEKIYKDSAFSKDTDLLHKQEQEEQEIDHLSYRPVVNENREWLVSINDLNYLRLGCYVLGCGGGGNPYPAFIEICSAMKNNPDEFVRVIHYKDAHKYTDDGIGGIVTVGGAGSPTVGCEQLRGPEYLESFELLQEYVGKKITGVICCEIGGGNGLSGIRAGLKSNFGLPVIDVDLMGRAYPELQQIVATIYDIPMCPAALSDGNGNTLIFPQATSTKSLERMIRATLSEVGASVSVTTRPQPVSDMHEMSCHNTLSLAWRIGRAIMISRASSNVENLPSLILDAVGGDGIAGKLLFRGKIIGVGRKLFKGHVYGEVEIESADGNKFKIPFKNENICVEQYNEATGKYDIPVCSVPDLIAVCDNDTGDAIGTQDYRYGLQVFVLAMAPNLLWATPKGIEIGGPKAFGPAFAHIEYKPIGSYLEPVSVIDEFGPQQ